MGRAFRTTFSTWRIVMKKLPYLLVLSGLISVPALAEDAPASPFAFNVGVTTDYIFRGISQSQHDPAISGGIDYTHSSGLYAGTWLSTQNWVDKAGPLKDGSNLELDLYGGYKGTAGEIGYDVGFIHYSYDGSRNTKTTGFVTPETSEVYVGLSWKMLSMKYSHTVSKYFVGWGVPGGDDSKGSNYLELNATQDLGNGWGLLGHVGHQKVEHFSDANYTDWKLGVTKDVGFGTVTLAYSDTDADGKGAYHWDGKDVSKGVLALSFSKSF
jgi:uncharacterized protein (TIGR02001 family)